MDKYSLILIILIVTCIIVLLYKIIICETRKEQFRCNYTRTDGHSNARCMQECAVQAAANVDANHDTCHSETEVGVDNCFFRCTDSNEYTQNRNTDSCVYWNNGRELTKCTLNAELDISGTSVKNCIERCKDSTCEGCHGQFKIYDHIRGETVEGTYTNSIDDYNTKCNTDPLNHKYCSPCVKACLQCDSPQCSWTASAGVDVKDSFRNANFVINVIPKDGGADIVWNEEFDPSKIEKYIIFYYKVGDKNVNENNRLVDPLKMRVKNYNYDRSRGRLQQTRLTGLTNNVKYSVTINKISGGGLYDDNNRRLVSTSNTVYIVPSKVNLVDFSKYNRANTLKRDEVDSVGFFNEIKGKTFDISI